MIGIGFIAYNKLNEKPERIAVVMTDVDESHSAASVSYTHLHKRAAGFLLEQT